MSWFNSIKSLWRSARFETFEERLVLSAQPLADLASAAIDPIRPEADYGDVAPALAHVSPSVAAKYVHDNYGFTGRGQTVAVIDTGIAYDHTALGGGFGPGHRVIGGWDFAENDANPYDDGPFGFHGTHVAGILGSDHATHSGVARDVDLVALRVFDDLGNSELGWVESALQWVHQNRVQYNITTVNLSLGSSWNSNNVPNWATLEDEFQQLEADGIFISVAAGNSFDTYRAPGLSYPAASPYVIPVASYGSDGMLSRFSQRNDRVLVAPGEQITSAIPSHLFGGVGPSHYFMPVSGTSMAAPFVAGASAILRQAMLFAGYEDITQDTLYDHFRSTADLVYDTMTSASYHRVNLRSALDTLLADDYGSSANTAHAWGTLFGTESLTGTIGRFDDRDFFTFTAGQSGTISLTTDVSHDMVARWEVLGADGSSVPGGLTFEVLAGRTYTVVLDSAGGLGHYNIHVDLQPAPATVVPIDWGRIAMTRFDGESIAGETWYQFTADRDGIVTIESFFSHTRGNIDLEIYDAENRLIAVGNATGDYERLDVGAATGQRFLLRVCGTNTDVDFRITNLVQHQGGRIDVYGTAGDDVFSFTAGPQHTIVVNGVQYKFNGSATNTVHFYGGAGTDAVTLTGTAANDSVILRVGMVDFASTTYRVHGEAVENVVVRGGGGADRATLYDSSGDDVLVARPKSATLSGNGFSFTVGGFGYIYAYATAGGNDRAQLYDSAGDDRWYARPNYSWMRGVGYYNFASGFDRVYAYATAGGYDTAELYDSSGHDRFYAHPTYSYMFGTGFYNSGSGFENVRARAVAGGFDRAYLYGKNSAATAFGFEQILLARSDTNDPANRELRAVDQLFAEFGAALQKRKTHAQSAVEVNCEAVSAGDRRT